MHIVFIHITSFASLTYTHFSISYVVCKAADAEWHRQELRNLMGAEEIKFTLNNKINGTVAMVSSLICHIISWWDNCGCACIIQLLAVMVVVILESVVFESESSYLLTKAYYFMFSVLSIIFVLNRSVNYQEVAGVAGYNREQFNLNFSHETFYALLSNSNWNAYLRGTELIVNLQYLFANSLVLAWFSSKCPWSSCWLFWLWEFGEWDPSWIKLFPFPAWDRLIPLAPTPASLTSSLPRLCCRHSGVVIFETTHH